MRKLIAVPFGIVACVLIILGTLVGELATVISGKHELGDLTKRLGKGFKEFM